MGIYNFFKKRKDEKEERGFFDSLQFNSVGSYAAKKSMLLSTVYRCVEVISDSVAQLPIEPYAVDSEGHKRRLVSHPTYRLLNKEPNRKMSRFTLVKTMVTSMLLEGNAFAYIKRDASGNATNLIYIPSSKVSIIEGVEDIKYNVQGIKGLVESCNMIHLLNFSYDGILGVSTLKHAANTLGLAADSEAQARGFFKGGCNLAGILKVHSVLSKNQKNELRSSWMQAFGGESGTPNGVAVLSGDMDYTPITVNPTDAQLLETRAFNVIDICRFFGVSPVKVFDLSKSSYSTIEATQLAFLTDTLNPLLEKIELEFERKLYKPSERNCIDVRFDTEVLLRTDKTSLANYYSTLFNIGVVTVNDIRKAIDLPKVVAGGDSHFVQVNLQTLEHAKRADALEENVKQQEV